MLRKLTLFILIFSLFLGTFNASQKSEAFWGIGDIVSDPGNQATNLNTATQQAIGTTQEIFGKLKEFGLDKVAYIIAQRVAERLTQRLLSWANGGFEGNPFYVDDFGALARNIAKEESELLVTTALNQYDAQINPFIKTVVKRVNDVRDVYSDGISLDDVFGENWEAVYTDVNVGGTGSLVTIMEPFNNPIGLQALAEVQLVATIEAKNSEVQLDLLSNDGFLSFRECIQTNIETEYADQTVTITNLNFSGKGSSFQPSRFKSGMTGTVEGPLTAEQQAYNANPTPDANGVVFPPYTPGQRIIPVACLQYKTNTPGQAVANQLNNALDQPLSKTNLPDEFQELIANTFTTLVNGFTEAGLRKLSGTIENRTSAGSGPNIYQETTEDLEPSDWINAPFMTLDLDAELNGLYRTVDDDNQPLPAPELIEEGSIARAEKEILILNEMIADPVYGITELPPKLLQLDRCLPGPDGPNEKWITRLGSAIERSKDYKVATKKAAHDNSKADGWQDAITSLDILLNEKITEVRFNMRDDQKTIGSYQEIMNAVDQYARIEDRLREWQDALLRVGGVLGNLRKIKTDFESGTLTALEEARLKYRYSLIIGISTTDSVVQRENEKEELIAWHALIEDLQQTCQTEVAAKVMQDPAWGMEYQNKTLFCFARDLNTEWRNAVATSASGAGSNIRDNLNLECKDYYSSSILDYTPGIF